MTRKKERTQLIGSELYTLGEQGVRINPLWRREWEGGGRRKKGGGKRERGEGSGTEGGDNKEANESPVAKGMGR